MADPRVLRTRAAIHHAVAELARERSVTQLSVTEVAEAAGINRVTFYKHYSSPAEALSALLSEELDTLREHSLQIRLNPVADARASFEASIRSALAHLNARHEIYYVSLATPNDHVAYELLLEHVTGTVRIFVETIAPQRPELAELDREVVSRFLGHGYCGALLYWLETGRTDEDTVIRSVRALLPQWWFAQQS